MRCTYYILTMIMNFFHLKSPALYVWYMYWSVAVSINLTRWLFTFIDRLTKINTSHKITSKQSARKVKCSIFIQVVVLTSLPWTREFVWRPTNNQNIWILKIPQCSIGKNVQRRHMMLFGAQFRTCSILGKNEMEWQNYLPPKSRMEPCESKTPLYLFSHPPTLDLEEAGGDGRAGRNFPSTIKPVLSGHPGEWHTDCLIQVDLLIHVWQTWENIQEK